MQRKELLKEKTDCYATRYCRWNEKTIDTLK